MIRTFFPLNAQAWTLFREDGSVVRVFIASEGACVTQDAGGLKLASDCCGIATTAGGEV